MTMMRNMILAASALLAGASLAAEPKIACRYVFDALGARPATTDLSGHVTDTLVYGNVTGGKTTNAKCYRGFTATDSYVAASNVVGVWGDSWNHAFTCVAWVRNPDMTSTSNHLIARGSNNNSKLSGGNSDNAWQAWITPDGRIGLGLQHWGGVSTNNLKDTATMPPVCTWATDVWYQVAIVQEYKFINQTLFRHLSAYVTAAGSTSIGPSVAELEMFTPAGGSGKNLVIGAAPAGYYSTGIPAGFFKGEIAEVTVYDRVLTTEELLSDVTAFTPTYHPIDAVAKFHWPLDECGSLPTAIDATTNNLSGTTLGQASGGYAAPTGTCYGGFSTTSDKLYATLPATQYFQNGLRNEILFWVRRPEPTSKQQSLLVQNMKDINAAGGSQPWRVSVVEGGAVAIAMQSWNGKTCKTVGEPYEWGNGWNLVSVRFDQVSRDKLISSIIKNEDGTSTTNYQSGACNRIRVYAAPAAKTASSMSLIATAEMPYYNSLFESGKYIVFGSVGSGYYKEFQPAAVLGPRGRIGEASCYIDGWFEDKFRDSLLTDYYRDPRGLFVIVK